MVPAHGKSGSETGNGSLLRRGLTMNVTGTRLKRTRYIHSDRYVVAVEVEIVVPDDDPAEPCYEPHTVRFLKEVKERADANDLPWLKQHGKVYAALDAA